jgi:dTMP kinase
MLIAFEGLDQSGKQTQVARLAARLRAEHTSVQTLAFPDHRTPIGREIEAALHGKREFPADVLQLLFVANRGELRQRIRAWREQGTWVLCDRYVASSIAYGEAQGLDPAWLRQIQVILPPAEITVLLDLPPEVSAARKREGRDRFERDLALLALVRDSYMRQARENDWVVVDATRSVDDVAAAILEGLAQRLPSFSLTGRGQP